MNERVKRTLSLLVAMSALLGGVLYWNYDSSLDVVSEGRATAELAKDSDIAILVAPTPEQAGPTASLELFGKELATRLEAAGYSSIQTHFADKNPRDPTDLRARLRNNHAHMLEMMLVEFRKKARTSSLTQQRFKVTASTGGTANWEAIATLKANDLDLKYFGGPVTDSQGATATREGLLADMTLTQMRANGLIE